MHENETSELIESTMVSEEILDTDDEVEVGEPEKKLNRCANPKKCCCCIKIDTGVHLINIGVIVMAVYQVSTYNTFLSDSLTPVQLFSHSIMILIYSIFLCDT